MIRSLRRFMKGRRGQGMTEYIIIVALIAIAALTIYTVFGKQIRSVMASIGMQLGGKPKQETKSYQGNFKQQRNKKVDMDEFGNKKF
ncbi:MAG: hypothetical protein GY868_08750 [Deltaproteobacteria bacterium]|nr:hypothetical protein [Deltaproteobacteria bacterium]